MRSILVGSVRLTSGQSDKLLVTHRRVEHVLPGIEARSTGAAC